MAQYLCIATTFLAQRYHGKEWPPSPARLFQALVAGAKTGCYKEHWGGVEPALRAIEGLSAPDIIATSARRGVAYRIAVPNNDSDKAAREWRAGRSFDPSSLRTLKTIAPHELPRKAQGEPHLYYLWRLHGKEVRTDEFRRLTSFLHTFGWGIDMAYADCALIDDAMKQSLLQQRDCFHMIPANTGQLRDVPTPGYLDDLTQVYKRLCARISIKGVDPATRATKYGQQRYRRIGDISSPVARFVLRQLDDQDRWFVVPWPFGMRVAAWMRHAVAEALLDEGHDRSFVNSYVLGHGDGGHRHHMSFIPVPTIRTMHADGGIRRVMVLEPQAEDGSISDLHIAELIQWKLASSVLSRLVDQSGGGSKSEPVCSLAESQNDGVWSYYLPERKKHLWHSVTPVVLHGFNSLRGKLSLKKTEELLYQAFEESGYPRHSIEHLCFQPAPFWAGTEGALAMRVPTHLSKWPRYHVAVRFCEPVAGPVLAGIGRHYGIGLFAAAIQ